MELDGVNIGITGRYWATVHDGHTFDEDGNLIKEGNVRERTGKAKNIITTHGFNTMATSSGFSLAAVAGAGNTPATIGDTVLNSFKGYTNTLISAVKTFNSTPDVDGYVYYRILYRFSFAPGSLGSGAVNISEAGMAFGGGYPTALTQLGSRGLLVDALNAPTSVSLNASTEYLDLYWEATFYVKAETSSSVNLTIDGVVTAHDIVIRPLAFNNSEAVPAWMGITGKSFPSHGVPRYYAGGNALSACRLLSGPLGTLLSKPAGTHADPSLQTTSSIATYVPGSGESIYTITYTPPRGNVVGGAGAMTLLLANGPSGSSYWSWQIGFDPKIPKDATKQLDLVFKLKLANK